jgi:hypothetical protein
MNYAPGMRAKLQFVSVGIVFSFFAMPWLPADQLEMQNGDHLSGKVLSVSADAVVLESEVLGKITVPRKKVVGLAFGTNTVAPAAARDAARVSVPTNLPTAAALAISAKTNFGTNFVRQIREQMLAGSPEAAGKYDEMINGLMNGKLNLNDLRREAKVSADQLRELKRELGSDAGDALDGYLEVLNNFLKETVAEPTNATKARIPR